MLSELLDWVDELPIRADTVDRYVPRAARDLARGLFTPDKEILKRVRTSREGEADSRFFDLLRNHYVFAYEAGTGQNWYGLNPLMEEISL